MLPMLLKEVRYRQDLLRQDRTERKDKEKGHRQDRDRDRDRTGQVFSLPKGEGAPGQVSSGQFPCRPQLLQPAHRGELRDSSGGFWGSVGVLK